MHLHGAPADPEQSEDGEDGEWVLLEDEDSEAEKTAGFLKLQEADLVTLFNQVSDDGDDKREGGSKGRRWNRYPTSYSAD